MSTRTVEVAPERWDRWRERFAANNPDGPQRLAAVERFDHDPLAVLLVRRGGFAVGLARGGILLASKVGSRHVQSRTAAGGWSQQRFARRRANQADALVHAVADHLQRVLMGMPQASGLVVGGDRELAGEVLSEPTLRWLTGLPTREFYDLPNPTRRVLEDALRRGRAVRAGIEDSVD